MADRSIGRSEPLISAPVTTQRMGSATDRQRRRNTGEQHQDRDEASQRRGQDPVNTRRRRLFDLLFFEIDRAAEMGAGQKKRLKDNLRAHIEREAMVSLFAEPPPKPEDVQALLDASENPDDHPDLDVKTESLAAAVAAPAPEAPPEEIDENAQLAEQFRACLEINTATARKVALYLKLLIRLTGAMAPRFVVDV
jgi:hypothetical protein